jgi:hypothetical protein
MLKTLDILIGAVTVLLLFSMAVTVITQAVTSLLNKRGTHLLAGLASLIQQIGIPERDIAQQIAHAVLSHPIIAETNGKLGTVIHRQEFTRLLMDLAASRAGASALEPTALSALQQMLKANGITDPAQTLKNIRTMTLVIAASNPTLANHVRDEVAILQEAASDYVAKVHTWFDQSMDRVSQSFARHAQRVTVVASFVVVLAVQLDIIAVVDRLSIDDQFRASLVNSAVKDFSNKALGPAASNTSNPPAGSTATQPASTTAPPSTGNTQPATAANTSPTGTTTPAASTTPAPTTPAPSTAAPAPPPNVDPHPYYDLLNVAGLITLPTSSSWFEQIKDPRKYPGMVLSFLLISLGAPFWYNILKNLIGLRSSLAQTDDDQRAQRQSSQPQVGGGGAPAIAGIPATTISAVIGEIGKLPVLG